MGKTNDAAKAETDKGRRAFLKMAAAGAPAAVAAVATSGTQAEAGTPQPASGMQDTAHTRAYYDSARF